MTINFTYIAESIVVDSFKSYLNKHTKKNQYSINLKPIIASQTNAVDIYCGNF